MDALALFRNRREGAFFLAGVLLLFALNLFSHYREYQALTASKFFDASALVIDQYQKTNQRGTYTVLKLTGDQGTFYTTSREDLKNLEGRKVTLALITNKITFVDYLRGFYAPSFRLSLAPPEPESLRRNLLETVTGQHENPLAANLYAALFLAEPLEKPVRNTVSVLGWSHLVALSGFHLGLISLVLYGLLTPAYRFFQARLFPWRNRKADLAVAVLAVLAFYLWLTGMVPSLLRAFAMTLLGAFLLFRNIRLLSFQTLAVAVLLVLALFPKLLLSIGFWFSVSGVFFIYLFLHHCREWPKIPLALGLNLFVFAAMLPVVHAVFPVAHPVQWLSPAATLIFTLFYPAAFLLHLLGLGALGDGGLEALFKVEWNAKEVWAPPEFLGFYLLVALGAIRWKALFWGTALLAFGFGGKILLEWA